MKTVSSSVTLTHNLGLFIAEIVKIIAMTAMIEIPELFFKIIKPYFIVCIDYM